MKPILAASLLALTFALAACGGPSDEDVLTADKIRASESAPELPDVQLSENPEPPPAPAAPPQPEANELDNAMLGNEVEPDPLAPAASGAIPAAFQDQWGQRPADCRSGGGLIVSGDSLMSRESVGRLVEVVNASPGRFIAFFDYDGQERQEDLVLAGGGDALLRNGVTYRRCSAAGPTG